MTGIGYPIGTFFSIVMPKKKKSPPSRVGIRQTGIIEIVIPL